MRDRVMTDPLPPDPTAGVRVSADPAPAAPPDRPLRIEVPYRVRFDEATPAGLLRSSACLGYLQDVAWRHSEALGFGRDWYRDRGLAWLVRAVDLRLVGPVGDGDLVTVSTQVTGFRRVLCRRDSEIAAAGALAGTCRIDWAMTDGRTPVRIPGDFAAFGIGASFVPTRVDLPPAPDGAAALAITPRLRECDPMGHVNNGVYVDWLDEAVTAAGGDADVGAFPRRYRLEYFRPATAGAPLVARAWRDEEGWAFRLVGEEGDDLVRGRLLLGARALDD